jgi:hypothetical protein
MIHDVVVAMSQLPARKTPSEDAPDVDVFVVPTSGRSLREIVSAVDIASDRR